MPYPDLAIATAAYQLLPRSTAAYGYILLLALALKPFLDHDRGLVSGEKDDAEATTRHRVPVRVGSHTGAEAELVGVTLSGAERVEAVALAVTASPYQSMYAGFLVAWNLGHAPSPSRKRWVGLTMHAYSHIFI